MASKPPFYQWLMRYRGEGPIGDLRDDAKNDWGFIQAVETKEGLFRYLEKKCACEAAVAAAKRTWKLFCKERPQPPAPALLLSKLLKETLLTKREAWAAVCWLKECGWKIPADVTPWSALFDITVYSPEGTDWSLRGGLRTNAERVAIKRLKSAGWTAVHLSAECRPGVGHPWVKLSTGVKRAGLDAI